MKLSTPFRYLLTASALCLFLLGGSNAAEAQRQIKQNSTAYPLLFLMIDSTDHISGKTGLTCTVTISKNGGSFASPSGAVTEIANGWYKVAGNATDTATLGPLILHATGTGADVVDLSYDVVAYDPQNAFTDTITNISSGLGITTSTVNDGSPTTTGFVTSLSSSTTDFFKGKMLVLSNGSGSTQGAFVRSYNGTTKAVTLSPALRTAPANGATFVLVEIGAMDRGTDFRAMVSADTHTAGVTVAAVTGNVGGSVNSVTGLTPPTNFNLLAIDGFGRVTVGSNADKTGYSLSQAFPSGFASWTAPLSAASTGNAFLDAVMSGHTSAGTAGEALQNAGSGGDPWSTSLPGSYAPGTAGYFLGTYINAPIAGVPAAVWALGTRTLTSLGASAPSWYTTPATVAAIAAGILTTPANLLATDAFGRVTVGAYGTGLSPKEQVINLAIPGESGLTFGQAMYMAFAQTAGQFGTPLRSPVAPWTITVPFIRKSDGVTVFSYTTVYTDGTFGRSTGRSYVTVNLPNP